MKTLSILLLYVLWATFACAQSKELCGSNLDFNSVSKNDPAFYKRIMVLEEHTRNFIRASKTTGAV